MPPVTRPNSKIHQLLKCCAAVRRGTGVITNGTMRCTLVTQDKAYMAVYARHRRLQQRQRCWHLQQHGLPSQAAQM
jgi:hypothetical protein